MDHDEFLEKAAYYQARDKNPQAAWVIYCNHFAYHAFRFSLAHHLRLSEIKEAIQKGSAELALHWKKRGLIRHVKNHESNEDSDRNYLAMRFDRLEKLVTSAKSESSVEDDSVYDRLKQSEEEKRVLEQKLRSAEMRLKQQKERTRALLQLLMDNESN